MTLGQVGCIDLAPNISCNPRVAPRPDSESDCHYRPERNIQTLHPAPILITFDENRFLQNDERFDNLSSRSRFFIILAMMLPLSVAFTALSNHIIVPISYHISSEFFSPTGDKVYKINHATNRKTLFAKIVTRHQGEVRNSAKPDFTTIVAAFLSWNVSSMDIDSSISWLLEKSQLRYMFNISVKGIMHFLDGIPQGDVTPGSNILKRYDAFDTTSLVQQIWNNGQPLQESKKASEREFLFTMSDPMLPWIIDSTSPDSKASMQSPTGNFPLIQRLLGKNRGKVEDPVDKIKSANPVYPKRDNWQQSKMSINKESSINPSRPVVDEDNLLESFIPMVYRFLSPVSSGPQTDTHTNPTPFPQLHTRLTQSAQSLNSDSDQSLETSHLSSRTGNRQRGTHRRSTSIRFRRASV